MLVLIDWEKVQSKIQGVTFPAFIHKLSVLFIKIPLLKTLDLLNLFYRQPVYTGYSTIDLRALDALESQKRMAVRIDSEGLYIAKIFPSGFVDNGDQCLHAGLYNAYLFTKHRFQYDRNISKPMEQIMINYLTRFIDRDTDVPVLLRGRPDIDTASGDQLTGMFLAVHAYLRTADSRYSHIKQFQDLIIQIVKDGYVLRNLKGQPTEHGRFNSNFLMIGGASSVILAAVSLACSQSDSFNYLWDKCGYEYLIQHTDPYLWSDIEPVSIFGRDIYGQRAWFGANIAIISLSILHFWTVDLERRVYIKKAIMKILNRDKWNIWLWLIAVDNRVILPNEVPRDAIQYFNTYVVPAEPPFYTLSNQPTDFVWQRCPFQQETGLGYFGPVDFLYTKLLFDRYLRDLI